MLNGPVPTEDEDGHAAYRTIRLRSVLYSCRVAPCELGFEACAMQEPSNWNEDVGKWWAGIPAAFRMDCALEFIAFALEGLSEGEVGEYREEVRRTCPRIADELLALIDGHLALRGLRDSGD